MERAFDEETLNAFGEKFLEILYGNWSETVRILRRTVLLGILAIFTFVLMCDSQNGELTIGLLKTNDFTPVLVILPALVSFILFEAIDLTLTNFYYQDLASALMEKLHPKIYEHDLELALAPPTSFAWGAGTADTILPASPGRMGRLYDAIAGLLLVGAVLGVLAFLVYAYVNLYRTDASWIAVSISLVFALFNCARTALRIKITSSLVGERH